MAKQIERVLAAVDGGLATSYEVGAAVGISMDAAAAWLGQLERLGMIERTGETFRRDDRKNQGQELIVWRSKKERSGW